MILYAPHNFAESNHPECGDLIFRDFYQQTFETLEVLDKIDPKKYSLVI